MLRVAGLTAKPLRLADAVEGTPGGLLGYPGNGPYAETAVRVGRVVRIVGRDAYGNFPTGRRVTTMRGTIRSGNSGGPVVDAQGRVITTVFAQRARHGRRLRRADGRRARRARARRHRGARDALRRPALANAAKPLTRARLQPLPDTPSSRSSAASGCLNGGIT